MPGWMLDGADRVDGDWLGLTRTGGRWAERSGKLTKLVAMPRPDHVIR